MVRNAAGAQLQFSSAWAERNPRTLYLLQQEAEAWARSGVFELSLGAPADAPLPA